MKLISNKFEIKLKIHIHLIKEFSRSFSVCVDDFVCIGRFWICAYINVKCHHSMQVRHVCMLCIDCNSVSEFRFIRFSKRPAVKSMHPIQMTNTYLNSAINVQPICIVETSMQFGEIIWTFATYECKAHLYETARRAYSWHIYSFVSQLQA